MFNHCMIRKRYPLNDDAMMRRVSKMQMFNWPCSHVLQETLIIDNHTVVTQSPTSRKGRV